MKVLYYYYCAGNNISHLVDGDIQRLTANHPRNMEIYALVDTADDSYSLTYCDKKWERRKATLDMAKKSTFDRLFRMKKSKTKPSEMYFLFAGHGDSFSLQLETKKEQILTETFAQNLSENKFDLIMLDSCMMGSFENLYALRNHTKFIIANKLYSYDIGFMNSKTISILDSDFSLKRRCKKIINQTVKEIKHLHIPEEYNAVLLETSQAENILNYMNEDIFILSKKFNELNEYRIEMNEKDDTSYLDMYRFFEDNLEFKNKSKLLKCINDSIVYFLADRKSKLTGLSICTKTDLYKYKTNYYDQELFKKCKLLQILSAIHSVTK